MNYVLMSEKFPVAAKEHKCIWCGEKILKGERHRFETSISDGQWWNNRWHLECDDDAKECAAYEGGPFEFSPYSAPRPPQKFDTIVA
jgi:hypothetical protein